MVQGINDMTTADLDGDGYLDVVVTANNRIVWFRQEPGTGGFSPPMLILAEVPNLSMIIAADIDGDGDMDIIFAWNSPGQVSWIENLDGAGQFGPAKPISTTPLAVAYLYSADLDGDGDMDLVVSSNSPMKISWYRNLDGAGNFSDEIIIPSPGFGPSWIFAEDLDGDGDLDLVCTHSTSGEGAIVIHKNEDGQGAFGAAIVVNNTVGTKAIVAADVDNDGDLDIIAVSENSSYAFWHENIDGMGAYGPMNIIQTGLQKPVALSAGDLDGDGYADFAVASREGKKIWWFKNLAGTGGFSAPIEIADMNLPRAIFIADFNGDGHLDVLTNALNINQIAFFPNLNGTGNFGNPVNLTKESSSPEAAIAADVDGDGDIDIIASFPIWFDGEVSWFENENSAFSFQKHPIYNSEDRVESLTICDLNLDGNPDLAVSLYYKDQIEWLPHLDGQGLLFGPPQLVAQYDLPRKFVTGDLDGDGYPDVVVVTTTTTFWVRNKPAQGAFQQEIFFHSPQSAGAEDAFIADVDGDGFNDVLIAYAPFSQSMKISWFKNLDGQGNFGPEIVIASAPSGGHCWAVHAADVDGDGDLDVVYGLNGIFWKENLDGAGNFGESKYVGVGTYGHTLGTADLDMDGDLDIYSAHLQIFGVNWFENLDGAGNFHNSRKVFSGATKSAYPADLDGDGDLDFVISSASLIWVENQFANLPRINGLVFWDQNENGIQDGPEEIGLNNQPVFIQPAGIASFSFNGAFYFLVNEGDYEVFLLPAQNWELTNDGSHAVSLQGGGAVSAPPFGLKPAAEIYDGRLDISSGPTRCHEVAPFWVTYRNLGTTYGNGSVRLTLPALASFVEAQPAPDLVNGDELVWNFQNLPPTYNDQILLYLQMPDENFAGQLISLQAELILEDGDGNFLLAHEKNLSRQITCAIDPNDKLVEPNIPDNENYTLFGDTLQYTIRFQNTGNDTAYTVRIVDQLSPDLDLGTFRLVAYSHPCAAFLDSHGKLTFLFENIMLPDSVTNEPGSHGFVKFEIVPKNGLPENTLIDNYALIFFDLNAPIKTNTTTNVLVSAYPLSVASQNPLCHDSQDGSIQAGAISPEPVEYHWSNGQTGSVLAGLGAGVYYLQVKNSKGQIVGADTISLIGPPPIALSFISDPETETNADGSALVLSAGGTPPYAYLWNTDPPQITEVATGLSAGAYTVVVTDANGCSQIGTAQVGQIVSTTEALGKWNIQLFPNPAQGTVNILFESGNPEPLIVRIHDVTGRLFAERLCAPSIVLPVEGIPAGLYEVSFWTKGGILAAQRKLVVVEE